MSRDYAFEASHEAHELRELDDELEDRDDEAEEKAREKADAEDDFWFGRDE